MHHKLDTPKERAERLFEVHPQMGYLPSQVRVDLETEMTQAELLAYKHAEAIITANLEYCRRNPKDAAEALSDALRDIRAVIGGKSLLLPGFNP